MRSTFLRRVLYSFQKTVSLHIFEACARFLSQSSQKTYSRSLSSVEERAISRKGSHAIIHICKTYERDGPFKRSHSSKRKT